MRKKPRRSFGCGAFCLENTFYCTYGGGGNCARALRSSELSHAAKDDHDGDEEDAAPRDPHDEARQLLIGLRSHAKEERRVAVERKGNRRGEGEDRPRMLLEIMQANRYAIRAG